MDEELKSFNKVKENLSVFMSYLEYKLCIETIRPFLFEGNTLYLEVKNEDQKDMLQDRYFSLINEQMIQVYNKVYDIKYILALSSKHSISHQMLRLYDQHKSNPKNSFQNFIVGDSNKYAFDVIRKIGENKEPFGYIVYLYGDSGTGKTHLLNALTRDLESEKEKVVLFLNLVDLMNEIILGVKNGQDKTVMSLLNGVDILLIDDIHFINGKERTQQILVDLIDKMIRNNKVIILSSSIELSNLNMLDQNLESRILSSVRLHLNKQDDSIKMTYLLKNFNLSKEFQKSFREEIVKKDISFIKIKGFVNEMKLLEVTKENLVYKYFKYKIWDI
ncbi:AAA family ATPase [Acidaminobacter sp. JC074]|uniref:DnaA ATPase domain-containing protein n=1 Tax=Acidaminobacter sp. JC074 TaxID=2530199 RepID=UPI001F110EC9|nr:DnaA/Hda family protein [Acidaminobacter sp. JC074]MCH4887871.1 AAA family ATPase [Acidaminobacter sp. JC074]